eukprot:PhM_4_TR561/c0_g1_i1/m.97175
MTTTVISSHFLLFMWIAVIIAQTASSATAATATMTPEQEQLLRSALLGTFAANGNGFNHSPDTTTACSAVWNGGEAVTTKTHPCDFPGITCDTERSVIVKFDFRRETSGCVFQTVGTDATLDLTSSKNDNLFSSVKEIYLSGGTRLVMAPINSDKIPHLEVLSVVKSHLQNQFRFTADHRAPTSLTTIDFSDNDRAHFVFPFPSNWCAMDKLRVYRVRGVAVTSPSDHDALPNSCTIPKLEEVDVSNSNLPGGLPTYTIWPSLKIFYGGGNKFSGSMRNCIFQVPSLEVFDVSMSSGLHSAVVDAICDTNNNNNKKSQMRVLDLSGTGNTGELPACWGAASPAWELINVSGTTFMGPVPSAWSALCALSSDVVVDVSHVHGVTLPLPAWMTTGSPCETSKIKWVTKGAADVVDTMRSTLLEVFTTNGFSVAGSDACTKAWSAPREHHPCDLPGVTCNADRNEIIAVSFTSSSSCILSSQTATASLQLELLSTLRSFVIIGSPTFASVAVVNPKLEVLHVESCPALTEIKAEGSLFSKMPLKTVKIINNKNGQLSMRFCETYTSATTATRNLETLWIEGTPMRDFNVDCPFEKIEVMRVSGTGLAMGCPTAYNLPKTTLRMYDVSNNQFQRLDPDIFEFPLLTIINVSNNLEMDTRVNLTKICTAGRKQASFLTIDLSRSGLQGALPSCLGDTTTYPNLPHIALLNLSHASQFSGPIPTSWESMCTTTTKTIQKTHIDLTFVPNVANALPEFLKKVSSSSSSSCPGADFVYAAPPLTNSERMRLHLKEQILAKFEMSEACAKKGWSAPDSTYPCDYYGVSCDVKRSTITQLAFDAACEMRPKVAAELDLSVFEALTSFSFTSPALPKTVIVSNALTSFVVRTTTPCDVEVLLLDKDKKGAWPTSLVTFVVDAVPVTRDGGVVLPSNLCELVELTTLRVHVKGHDQTIARGGGGCVLDKMNHIEFYTSPSSGRIAGAVPSAVSMPKLISFVAEHQQLVGGLAGTVVAVPSMTTFRVSGSSQLTGDVNGWLCDAAAAYRTMPAATHEVDVSATGVSGALPSCLAADTASVSWLVLNLTHAPKVVGPVPSSWEGMCSKSTTIDIRGVTGAVAPSWLAGAKCEHFNLMVDVAPTPPPATAAPTPTTAAPTPPPATAAPTPTTAAPTPPPA